MLLDLVAVTLIIGVFCKVPNTTMGVIVAILLSTLILCVFGDAKRVRKIVFNVLLACFMKNKKKNNSTHKKKMFFFSLNI